MSIRKKARNIISVMGIFGLSVGGSYLYFTDESLIKKSSTYTNMVLEKNQKINAFEKMTQKYKFTNGNEKNFIKLFNRYTRKSSSFKELLESINKLKSDLEALALNIYYEGGITSEFEQYMIAYNTVNNSIQYKRSIRDAVYMKCGSAYCYSWVGMGKTKDVDRIPEKYFMIALNVLINPEYQKWNFGQIKYFHKEVVLAQTYHGNLKSLYKNSYHISNSKGNTISFINGKYQAIISNPKLELVDIGQININGVSINHHHSKDHSTLHQWFIPNNKMAIKNAVNKMNAYLAASLEHNLTLMKTEIGHEK